MKKILTLIAVTLLQLTSWSQEIFNGPLLSYTQIANSSTVEVTGFKDAMIAMDENSRFITIPETVMNGTTGTTFTVVRIAEEAFTSTANTLLSVNLPNTITSFGDRAFDEQQIENLVIPSGVTSIGFRAFGIQTEFATVTSALISPPNYDTFFYDRFIGFDARGHCVLTIPAGTRQAYVDAGWINSNEDDSPFFEVVEEISLDNLEFELDNSTNISVSNNTLHIENPVSKLLNYHIYDMAGTLLLTSNLEKTLIEGLATGVYIIKANFEEGKAVKKFIK